MAGTSAGQEKKWLEGFAEWVTACNLVHAGKYTYGPVRVVVGKLKKVRITCPEHGEFLQMPAKHKLGQGCPACAHGTEDQTLAQLHAKFPEQTFPDPLPSSKTPMTLTCAVHGEFKATSNQLLATKAKAGNKACPKCNREENGKKLRVGADKALGRLQAIFPDYVFDLPGGVLLKDKVKYICPEHGEKSSRLSDLLNGHGCSECGAKSRAKTIHSIIGATVEDNLRDLAAVHGGSLVFHKSQLTRTHQKVRAVCPKHGAFEAMLYSLKAGSGCPACSNRVSAPERELVDWLKGLGITVVQQCKDTLDKGELDILLPDHNLAIEYCGLYWHSEEKRGQSFHLRKHEDAKKAGVRLITVFEDEWLHKKGIVRATLMSILGLAKDRVFARNTAVERVEWSTVAGVYEEYHLQGAGTPCKDNLVLKHNGAIVAAASFRADRFGDNDLELVRYVTTTKVVGGFSKLLKAYCRDLAVGTKVVSYVDYRWFTGETYKKAGFVWVSDSKPGYWWCKGTSRYSRFAFQKHKLSAKLDEFNPDKSESWNMVSYGFWKVWDCGMGKWELVT